MTKFFKSQYFEDKSVSKYSVFLLSNRFLKEFTKKVLIVKQLSLLSIKMLVYPNLKTLRQLSHHCCANAKVVVVV